MNIRLQLFCEFTCCQPLGHIVQNQIYWGLFHKIVSFSDQLSWGLFHGNVSPSLNRIHWGLFHRTVSFPDQLCWGLFHGNLSPSHNSVYRGLFHGNVSQQVKSDGSLLCCGMHLETIILNTDVGIKLSYFVNLALILKSSDDNVSKTSLTKLTCWQPIGHIVYNLWLQLSLATAKNPPEQLPFRK